MLIAEPTENGGRTTNLLGSPHGTLGFVVGPQRRRLFPPVLRRLYLRNSKEVHNDN